MNGKDEEWILSSSYFFSFFFFEKSFGNEVRPFKLKRGRSMVIIDNDEMKRMKGKKKVMRRTSADKRKFFARYMCQKCNNGTVTGETRHAIRRAHAYHKATWTNSTISPWKKNHATHNRAAGTVQWDAVGRGWHATFYRRNRPDDRHTVLSHS